MPVLFAAVLQTSAPSAPAVYARIISGTTANPTERMARTAMTPVRTVGADTIWEVDVANFDNSWPAARWQFDTGANLWCEGQLIVNVAQANGAEVQLSNAATIVVQSAATVTAPIDPGDDDRLTLVQGDDYDVAGNIPTWSITGYTGPSLAGGTGKLRLVPIADYDRDGPDATAQLVVDAAVVQAGTDLTVTAPITSAQVLTLNSTPPYDVDTHQYQLVGITSAGKSRTLRLSPATVRRRVKP